MSGREPTDPNLDRILTELTDDLMQLSDAELMAELEEDGIDGEAEAEAARAAVAMGIAKAGRARMKAAREAVQRDRKARVIFNPVRRDRQLAILSRFAEGDPKLKARLTMAARNGQELTGSEIQSIISDLRELGAIDENGDLG